MKRKKLTITISKALASRNPIEKFIVQSPKILDLVNMMDKTRIQFFYVSDKVMYDPSCSGPEL